MKKTVLGAFVVALIATPAFADPSTHTETKSSGTVGKDYKSETETEAVNAAGTKTTSKTTREDGTTWTGAREISVESHTTADPKGLGNKTTSEAKTSVRVRKDGDLDRKTQVDSVDAAGTARRTTQEIERDVARSGAVDTTISTKEVVDPKGLMNKTVTEVDTRVHRNPDGSTVVSTEKKVDGDVVEKEVN